MDAFDKIAAEWNEFRKKPISCLSFFLPLVRKTDAILDAGCGNGRNLVEIAKRCRKIEGIDSSKEMVEYARKNTEKAALENCEVSAGSILKLPYKKNEFDKIFCSAVLHHLKEEEQMPAISELKRVLKPGGMVFATVWAETRFKGRREGLVKWGEVQRYHYFFTKEEFETLFDKTGFSQVKTFYEKDGVVTKPDEGQNLVLMAQK